MTAAVGRRVVLTTALVAALAVALAVGTAIVRRLGAPEAAPALGLGAAAPEIAGGPWINSGPLTMAALRGRVVLVEFWTYG